VLGRVPALGKPPVLGRLIDGVEGRLTDGVDGRLTEDDGRLTEGAGRLTDGERLIDGLGRL
jgi:hypothetical protein